jgi:hypothetical protein
MNIRKRLSGSLNAQDALFPTIGSVPDRTVGGHVEAVARWGGFAGRMGVSLVALPLWAFSSAVAAQDEATLPTLYTNEQYIADAVKESNLDIADVKSVLQYILSQLPDRVKVFPTENYYYFYFYYGGVKYAGNFRFDVDERDRGLVRFIYFKDSTEMSRDEHDYRATLGQEVGVLVEKVEDLVYRVTFAGRSVTFELNDLSQVTPTGDALGDGETFLGPVADESGVRFFLTFDEKLKIFHYVLDETAPASDELVDVPNLHHIQIGRRTSFAFLVDPIHKRKLLVGVFGPNSSVNNYLDGPFDQLPDNFLKGDELRRALLLEDPDRDQTIDRLGVSPGGNFREMIAPYVEYYEVSDLAPADKCAEGADRAAIYLCLDALSSE